jgi:hypothetical protein
MKFYFNSLKFSCLILTFGFLSIGSNLFAQSFTEGFETTSTFTDWYYRNNSDTIASTTLAANWSFADPLTTFSAQAGSANSFLSCNYASSNNTLTGATLSNWLFTPARTFANGDVISFYSRITSSPSLYPDRLEVRLSTAGSGLNVGTSSASVGDFTTVLLTINPSLSTTGYPGSWTLYTATISGLSAPTTGRVAFRYYVTNGGPAGLNSDFIGIDSYTYTSNATAPANDNCAGAINLIQGASCTPTSGTVLAATQSQAACGDGNANDDVWYKFTATSNGANVTVDGSTSFDAVFEVFSGTCAGLTSLGCVDATLLDGIETTTLNSLTIGQTYYIRVFDWYSSVAGTTDFNICVTQFSQCDLTQPAGSILETETCGQDLNGGCNMVTPAYQSLTCGQTVFGKAWNNGTNKDTDWYSFVINTPGIATFNVSAEFPFLIYFLDISNCASPVALATATSNACQSATISYNFSAAGTYVAFIAPNVFSGYACNSYNDYIATLNLPASVPVVSAVGATSFCPGGSVQLSATQSGNFAWFNGSTNLGNNTSTLTATAPGSYSAQVTNNNGCLSVLSNAISVIQTALDDANFNYSSNTYCSGGSNATPTATLVGTYSSSPAGLTINPSTGEIDIANSTLGTYTILHNTNVVCPNSASQNITLTDNPDATFSYSNATFCSGNSNPIPSFGIGASSGVFSASPSGLSINPSTGEINLPSSNAGTYIVSNSIAATGSCPAVSADYSVTILAQPTAVVSGGGTICNAQGNTGSVDVIITFSGNPPFDFTYTDGVTPVTVNGHNSNTYTINATTTGAFSVISLSDGNCSNIGSGIANVNVFQNPTVTLSQISGLCDNQNQVTLNQGSPAGGVYSGNGVSNGILNPSIAGSGAVISYNYTDANGCAGSANTTITVNAAPIVSLASQATVCSYVPAFALSGGNPTGGTYSGNGVTGGNFDPATAGVGTQNIFYTFTSAEGCSATANQPLVVNNCAGIEESDAANNLIVFPNPAHESVMISFETTENSTAKIELLAVDGKLVFSSTLAASTKFNVEIQTVDFPEGIYLVKIQTGQGLTTKRIIVQ